MRGRGRRGVRATGPRLRHRWFDPPAGVAVRRGRVDQAELEPLFADARQVEPAAIVAELDRDFDDRPREARLMPLVQAALTKQYHESFRKFRRRFGFVERGLGKPLEQATLDEMELRWQEAKLAEASAAGFGTALIDPSTAPTLPLMQALEQVRQHYYARYATVKTPTRPAPARAAS